jgi:hypothetical protein
MRMISVAASVALLCISASSGFAADIAVPVKKAEAPKVAEKVCLRWIEQTYSWYNYCDLIPYYGRSKTSLLGDL